LIEDFEKAMSISTTTQQGVNEYVKDRLWDNPYRALRTISWDYRDGVLTLNGRLPTFYLKQMAQAAVARVAGIEHVVNRIEVAPKMQEAAG
jgi:osmotically-inducible protein OsmY